MKAIIENAKGSYIEEVHYFEDNKPAFSMDQVPFRFVYAHALVLTGKTQSFRITTIQSDFAHETFYVAVESPEKPSAITPTKSIAIHSPINRIIFENDSFGICCKIVIHFDQKMLYLYPADIYEQQDGSLDYAWGDEMVLAFDSETEARKFEELSGKL